MVAPHSPALPSDLQRAKQAARAAALERRARMDPALGARLALGVLRDAPPPAGAVVAGYWPIGDEIDIRPLLMRLVERGHVIVLPETACRGAPLCFRRWSPGEALVRERFGTFAPSGERMTPSFVLVPLLAFDRRGRRLGYGGGYYDRTLALLPQATLLGTAFAAQEMAEVPAGPGDVRLPRVATENGVILCATDE